MVCDVSSVDGADGFRSGPRQRSGVELEVAALLAAAMARIVARHRSATIVEDATGGSVVDEDRVVRISLDLGCWWKRRCGGVSSVTGTAASIPSWALQRRRCGGDRLSWSGVGSGEMVAELSGVGLICDVLAMKRWRRSWPMLGSFRASPGSFGSLDGEERDAGLSEKMAFELDGGAGFRR